MVPFPLVNLTVMAFSHRPLWGMAWPSWTRADKLTGKVFGEDLVPTGQLAAAPRQPRQGRARQGRLNTVIISELLPGQPSLFAAGQNQPTCNWAPAPRANVSFPSSFHSRPESSLCRLYLWTTAPGSVSPLTNLLHLELGAQKKNMIWSHLRSNQC